MEPPRIDYAVKAPSGSIVLTSPNRDVCIAWANKHCAIRYPLTVVQIVRHEQLIHRAERRLDAAS
jgi:hypothetical protein